MMIIVRKIDLVSSQDAIYSWYKNIWSAYLKRYNLNLHLCFLYSFHS